jgi:hypothetical protein
LWIVGGGIAGMAAAAFAGVSVQVSRLHSTPALHTLDAVGVERVN